MNFHLNGIETGRCLPGEFKILHTHWKGTVLLAEPEEFCFSSQGRFLHLCDIARKVQ